MSALVPSGPAGFGPAKARAGTAPGSPKTTAAVLTTLIKLLGRSDDNPRMLPKTCGQGPPPAGGVAARG
jgi:hypothetical protein